MTAFCGYVSNFNFTNSNWNWLWASGITAFCMGQYGRICWNRYSCRAKEIPAGGRTGGRLALFKLAATFAAQERIFTDLSGNLLGRGNLDISRTFRREKKRWYAVIFLSGRKLFARNRLYDVRTSYFPNPTKCCVGHLPSSLDIITVQEQLGGMAG